MNKLIKFELSKEIKSKKSIIYTLLIVIVCFFTIYLNNKSNEFKPEYNYITNYKEIIDIENNNKIVEYIKLNNYQNHDKQKYIIESSITLVMFLIFFTAFISSKILISEFDKGTIKNIVTKPYKRYEIYLSKFITTIILTLYYIFIIYLSYIIFTFVILKINILDIKELFINKNGVVEETIYLMKYTKLYFINAIPTVFLTLFSYNISFLFLNTYAGYILSICLSILGPTISALLFSLNFKIIKYTFLPYLDFNVLLNKINLFYMNNMYQISLNINCGIIILIIYLIITTFISLYIFNKKDIKK